MNDHASNNRSEVAAVNKQNEFALKPKGLGNAGEMQVVNQNKSLKDGVREEVAVSTTQVESVQAQMFASKAGKEDLGNVAETVKALPSQADAVKESKANETKIASTSRLESEAASNDDQAEPQVQIATASKATNKSIQKRVKQATGLPSNAAFTIPSEQEFLLNNNSNSPQTLPNSLHTHTDSLLYQNALRQYNTQQLDSALISLKPILNNSQGLYYKEGLKLQRQIIDKKKLGK
jgi:hypothetical protein